MRWFAYCGVALLLLVVLTEAKNEHEAKTNKKHAEKERKLGHWGEHWAPEDGNTDPAHIKDVMMHAPGAVSHHEAALQSEVSHKKPLKHKNAKKQRQRDMLMQDLMQSEHRPTEHNRHRTTNAEQHQEHRRQHYETAPKPMRNNHHLRTHQDETRTHHAPAAAAVPVETDARQIERQEKKERKKNKKATGLNKKHNKKKHNKKFEAEIEQ